MPKKIVNDIARDIVDVVKRARGPVTLVHIHNRVTGFAEPNLTAPSWIYEVEDATEASILWAGMTAEGVEALRQVLRRGLVTLCSGHRLRYLLEGGYLDHPQWVPVMLAPAKMANVCIEGRLFHFQNAAERDELLRLTCTSGESQWPRRHAA